MQILVVLNVWNVRTSNFDFIILVRGHKKKQKNKTLTDENDSVMIFKIPLLDTLSANSSPPVKRAFLTKYKNVEKKYYI